MNEDINTTMLCFLTDDNQFYVDRFVESYKQYCSGFDLTIVAGEEHSVFTSEQVYIDSKYMPKISYDILSFNYIKLTLKSLMELTKER